MIPETQIEPRQTGDANDHPEVMRHALAAINMLNLGIMVVDREARIIYANPFAKALLSSPNHPSAKSWRSGCALDRRLRRAISGRAHASDTYLSLSTSDDDSLVVLVVPCRNDEGCVTSSVLFVTDPTADQNLDLRPIAQLYGLTGAEIRLLDALLKGQTAGEYAKLVGVTRDAVKGHLNQLFRKTQTSRQSELVLRILANPASRVFPPMAACTERSNNALREAQPLGR